MNIDLPPKLVPFLQKNAEANGLTLEDYVLKLVEADAKATNERADAHRSAAPVNLALLDLTVAGSALEKGKAAREQFRIDWFDHKDKPVLVHIPDDMPTMTLKFFTGMFDLSIMYLGPEKFMEHYVFDADVGNLRVIQRYTRAIWEREKDTEMFRITTRWNDERSPAVTLWLQMRNNVTEAIDDELAVGGVFSDHMEAMAHIKSRSGRLLESSRSGRFGLNLG